MEKWLAAGLSAWHSVHEHLMVCIHLAHRLDRSVVPAQACRVLREKKKKYSKTSCIFSEAVL